MKKLLILTFIGAVALMGYYDGEDITGVVVLGMMVLPGMFERKDPSTTLRMTKKEGKVRCQIQTEDL